MARYPKKSAPKLTKELIEEIASIIRTGAYIETAVACCGISKDSFYRWLREAKKEGASALHLELSYAVERAGAEAVARDLLIIHQAAMGIPETYALNEDGSVKKDILGYPVVETYKVKPDWRAAAWRLEKRNPKQWGKESKGVMEEFDILKPPPISEEEQAKINEKRRKRIDQYYELYKLDRDKEV